MESFLKKRRDTSRIYPKYKNYCRIPRTFLIAMLLNYPALAVSLGIPNLQEHLRGSSRRKPTRSRTICDVRRACAALLVEQGYPYRAVGYELRCHPSAVCHFVRTHAELRANNADYERVAAVIFGLHAP